MIHILDDAMLESRNLFLSRVREFFRKSGYIEVETPLLNPGGNVEAFLDPFRVRRSAVPKSPEVQETSNELFLITSPEYNLKVQMAHSRKNLFQIAHSFREGDFGRIHREEFLMLEWYRRDCEMQSMIEETESLLKYFSEIFQQKQLSADREFERISIEELFLKFADCSLDFENLKKTSEKLGFTRIDEDVRYDEIFFLLFLNLIEKNLGTESPCVIYDYPPELAALSKIKNNKAKRFEFYWKGIELANGYEELSGRTENLSRFNKENDLRKLQGKFLVPSENQFLDSMDLLNNVSGTALGLDRLFMLLMNKDTLDSVSPFP